MSQGRTFSTKERRALFLAARGRCSICGEPLGRGWHADHVTPWSKGGETDVINGQALCSKCNLKKGAEMGIEFRPWQQDFIDLIERYESNRFLLVGSPASGKTFPSCYFITKKLKKNELKGVLIVSPTLSIKANWARDFNKFGVAIDDQHCADEVFKHQEYSGISTTYHSMAQNQLLYRHLVKDQWAVIFDEVHHLGSHQDSSWGIAAKEVADLSPYILMLSGTPFRTDKQRIPFVKYEGNRAVPDFELTYHEAASPPNKCVRKVFFKYYDATIKWHDKETEEQGEWTFDEELDQIEESRRLSGALRVLDQTSVVREMVVDANKELMRVRRTNPKAAAMVLCIDYNHAEAVAANMGQWIGVRPVFAASRDTDAQRKLDEFRESSDPWLVSIQMVSEGVDIPRLQFGVYATTTITEMFWRQAVGRFIRIKYGGDASIYLVSDPRLKKLAEYYTKSVDALVIEEMEAALRGEGEEKRERKKPSWQATSAEGELGGIIYSGKSINAEELQRIEDLKDELGLSDPPEKLAFFVQQLGFEPKGLVENLVPKEKRQPDELPKRKQEENLRKENQKAANRIAYNYGIEHKEVQKVLNRSVGIRSVSKDGNATIDKLRARLFNARDWYDSGVAPQ